MPALYRCLQGHLWEDVFDAPSLVDGQILCPLCRQASACEPASSSGPPSDPTPRAAPGVSLLARRPLAPVSPAVPGATVVCPALAQQPKNEAVLAPAGNPAHVETAAFECVGVGPITPSTRLPGNTKTRHIVDADDLPRGEWPTLPGYEILGELGRGGMGVVYKARQLGLNRIVALKMMLSGSQADERERARFSTEARAVARLQHPNIVQIFDVGEYQGAPYFSLEFVDGGSLADYLRGQPMPVHEAAHLLETLARAIHFAHEHGVIHRDLKPANVLLQLAHVDGKSLNDEKTSPTTPSLSGAGASGSLKNQKAPIQKPKITDFGLAKTLDEDVHNTRSGMIVGTPSYMAPEQASGQGNMGPGTDVYALGVLLYQIVTGRLPFTGDSPMDVLFKVARQDPPPPSRYVPRLARDLETITLKCLEKDPRSRYASAAALADDLGRFAAHEPIQARPVGAWERAIRLVRRRPGASSLAAAVCLVALSLLATLGVVAHGEQRRQARAREEVRETVQQARRAADRGNWENVRGLLIAPRDRVRSDPLLLRFAEEIETLARQAEGILAARSVFLAFQRSRDDALFHAILASGDSESQQEATRQKVLHALSVVGASGRSGPRAEPSFSVDEKDEVQRGCYELLLVLADATAHPLPGQAAEVVRGNARRALAVLDAASQLGFQTHAYHLHRARYLAQAGDVDRARKEREAAQKRPPATDLDHYLVGNEYYRQGNTFEAEQSFVKALNLKPRHFWARYFLALCHVRDKKLDAADSGLTSCLGEREGVVWIYLLRGLVRGQREQYREAEADFEKALALLKSQPDRVAQYALHNNRAVTRLGQHKYALAEQDLLVAVGLQPEQYHAHFTLSQVYQKQKKLPEALASLGRGIDVARKLFARKELDSGTLMMLHRCRYRLHLERGETPAALGELQAVIDLVDLPPVERAKAHRDRGHLLYRSGKIKAALSAYDAALKAVPGDVESLRWRAEVLLQLKRYAEAATGFDRYLAGGGKPFASIYRCRAIARAQIGDHQAALGDFTLALGLKPGDASLRMQRGRTYLACQAWKLAAQDFEAVLHRDPASAAAHHGRGLARLRLGEVSQAVDDAEKLARHAGQDARLVCNAACLLAQAAGVIEAGPGETAVRRRKERYQDRAVALLRQSLELLPAGERRSFWLGVQREAALRPLWSSSGFAQLDKRYGQPATPGGPR